jgi:putative pyruvate formate lyase activating enzyme
MVEPVYIDLARSGELTRRIEAANEQLRRCRLCPRNCEVDRLGGETGFCQTGARAMVSSFGPHFGEEDPLVGRQGSGTIFFTSCNLRCIFCQNFDISHLMDGREVEPDELARMMLGLQRQGCHNINFVTPSHVVPQILEALELAIEGGLRVPLVYNTGGHDAIETLRLLDGVVDIYMPDLKCMNREVARTYLTAEDYPDVVRAAIREMHRQVGDLQMAQAEVARAVSLRNGQPDSSTHKVAQESVAKDKVARVGNLRSRQIANLSHTDIAIRGLLVRHLVMPNGLAGTAEAMRFLANEISRDTYVNVMAQYRPCGQADDHPAINRPITTAEYDAAIQFALRAGIQRLDNRNRPHSALA